MHHSSYPGFPTYDNPFRRFLTPHPFIKLKFGSSGWGFTGMELDRTVVKVLHVDKEEDDGYVEGTMADRLAMVWEITRDAYSFAGSEDVERRLQRDVTNFIRGKS